MATYTVRVDCDPPLYFGPFTAEEAADASAELQRRYATETATYMMLPLSASEAEVHKAIDFNMA